MDDEYLEQVNIVKEKLRSLADNYGGATLTKGEQGGVIGALGKAFGTPEIRRTFLAWAFSDDPQLEELSTKALSSGQWYALFKWIDFFEEDGTWYQSALFHVEAEEVRQYLARQTTV